MMNTGGAYVYEVCVEERRKIMEYPPVSKEFLEDCKKVSKKYQKNNIEKQED